MDIESAKRDICKALDSLEQHANEEAMQRLLDEPKKLLEPMFRQFLYLGVHGIGYKDAPDKVPLTVFVRDMESGEYMQTFDPIADVARIIEDESLFPEEANEMINLSIASLKSGIERLEALRLKAQS